MNLRFKSWLKSLPFLRSFAFYKNAVYYFINEKSKTLSNTTLRINKIIFFLKTYFSYTFISSRDEYKRTSKLLRKIRIIENTGTPFFYSIDTKTIILYEHSVFGNLTPDYTMLLHNSIQDLKKKNLSDKMVVVLNDIEKYIDRCLALLIKKSRENEEKISALKRIKTNKAETFFEALQRILLINQFMWQEGHRLIGLGHLDKILSPYYYHDLSSGSLSSDKAFLLIKDFIKVLHRDYIYKSSSFLGDTGQIVILGGLQEDGTYICNDITHFFIQATKELHLPDPKLLVRISKNWPMALSNDCMGCIQTGIGYPLFSNDDIIIPLLQEFGYDYSDCFEYGTSACWEPFIIGKSSDANNLKSINFARPLVDVLNSYPSLETFSDFIDVYKNTLALYCEKLVQEAFSMEWEKAPLLSLFTGNCLENRLDIADGGAVYNNYGFTTVALPNTINSLFNIKKYVYDEKVITLSELNTILINDFIDKESIRKLLQNNANYYGSDNPDVIKLVNDIFIFASETTLTSIPENKKRKIKIGVSSPNYLSESIGFPATPDGRRKNDPFSVHISSENSSDYTSLFSFASKLDYSGNRFNGNVVDVMVAPKFIQNNYESFHQMVRAAFLQGVFQMQFNVLSASTLIEAKNSPDKFPNLIVRVWGFSAYFNDLPEIYKEVLIERALNYEYSHN
ncbi:pyruvate formate lyase family protein [Breznakiella homolactica]|uniref:Formate C-acetyltransferase n=1 Tax=Breznakiella homolactica TaxID=2798577 RepID=A0A7T7XP19_9SPIR|nr:pyruvate formate lyase family protein [Breznakiella homolactica]QQO09807.1 hypothetical protein JFL75_02545 [Breznakiella homolactica]